MPAGTAEIPENGAATWPGDGVHRIPYATYTRRDIYEEELARLFYRGHWCYVGLEAEVPNAGSVHFTPLADGRGTVVRVVMDVEPPAGAVGHLLAALFGEDPDEQVREELQRFKQLMEASGAGVAG